jgi:hypothetical protein
MGQFYGQDTSNEMSCVRDKLSIQVAAAALTCVHINVLVAPLRSAAKDEYFLGVAVRNRRDLAIGKLRSQVYRHRAPSASEVYDRHAVYYAWRAIIERIFKIHVQYGTAQRVSRMEAR